jgi:hypothetical protein
MMANGPLKASNRLRRWKLRLTPLRLLPRYFDPLIICWLSGRMTWAQDTSEAAVDTSAVQQPPTEAATAAAADRLVPAGGTRSCGHIVNKNGSCGGKGSHSCEVSKDCIQHRDANKPARGKKRKSADADLPQIINTNTNREYKYSLYRYSLYPYTREVSGFRTRGATSVDTNSCTRMQAQQRSHDHC